MKELLLIAIGSALVSNVVLSQFLGLCSFVGVSKKSRDSSWYGRCGRLRYYHRIRRCTSLDLSVSFSAPSVSST